MRYNRQFVLKKKFSFIDGERMKHFILLVVMVFSFEGALAGDENAQLVRTIGAKLGIEELNEEVIYQGTVLAGIGAPKQPCGVRVKSVGRSGSLQGLIVTVSMAQKKLSFTLSVDSRISANTEIVDPSPMVVISELRAPGVSEPLPLSLVVDAPNDNPYSVEVGQEIGGLTEQIVCVNLVRFN